MEIPGSASKEGSQINALRKSRGGKQAEINKKTPTHPNPTIL